MICIFFLCVCMYQHLFSIFICVVLIKCSPYDVSILIPACYCNSFYAGAKEDARGRRARAQARRAFCCLSFLPSCGRRRASSQRLAWAKSLSKYSPFSLEHFPCCCFLWRPVPVFLINSEAAALDLWRLLWLVTETEEFLFILRSVQLLALAHWFLQMQYTLRGFSFFFRKVRNKIHHLRLTVWNGHRTRNFLLQIGCACWIRQKARQAPLHWVSIGK